MRTSATWAAAIGFAVLACVVTAVTPVSNLAYSTNATRMPFDLPMTLGETTTGRTFTAEPTAVRAASSIEAEDGPVEGTFLIVDLVLDGTGVEPSTRLGGIKLELGERTYYPASRIRRTLVDESLRAGLPVAGSIVFELPPDDFRGRARVVLANRLDIRFDDRLVLDVDLDSLEPRPSVVVEPAGWAE